MFGDPCLEKWLLTQPRENQDPDEAPGPTDTRQAFRKDALRAVLRPTYPIVPFPVMGGLGGFCVGGLVRGRAPPPVFMFWALACGEEYRVWILQRETRQAVDSNERICVVFVNQQILSMPTTTHNSWIHKEERCTVKTHQESQLDDFPWNVASPESVYFKLALS